MKASTVFKLGLTSLIGAVLSFGIVGFGFELAKWICACFVCVGAAALLIGWLYKVAGKLENDL